MIQAEALTGPASYTTAQINPLTQTLTGFLKVSDAETIPATNYNTTHASNGVTSVTIVSAVTNYSIVVDAISIVNSNTATGHIINLCDGACSTSNWMPFPAPSGGTTNIGGAVLGGLKFATTKSALLAFNCQDACTTDVQVGVTYHLVIRP
jgi:hypothetical protein